MKDKPTPEQEAQVLEAAIGKTTVKISGILADLGNDEFSARAFRKINMLPISQRTAVIDYLCENSYKYHFDVDKLLYYSILGGCEKAYDVLKARGAKLPAEIRTAISAKNTFRGANMWWMQFQAILHYVETDALIRALRLLGREFGDDKIKFTMTFYQYVNFINDIEAFELVLAHFDQSRMNKTAIMKDIISKELTSCLAAAEQNGWLNNPQKRDEMIKYASDNGKTESAAWLLDFKNRTADLAAERAKAEKKMRRELNADPSSLSELKKAFRFKKKKDGTLIITSYSGHLTSIDVPAKIGNDKVTEIGEWAFSPHQNRTREQTSEFRRTITKITLPDGLKKIGEHAFCDLISLESVNIPKTVRTIGARAFEDCRSLKRIIVPEGVRYIGENAFSIRNGRGALEYAELPSTLEYFRESCKWRRVYLFDSAYCPDLVVSVPRGPYVEEFCEHNEVKFIYKEDK